MAIRGVRVPLVVVLLAASLSVISAAPAAGGPLAGTHATGTLSVLAGQIDPQCNKNGQPADSTCTKFTLTNCVGNDGAVLPEVTGYYSVARELAPGAARGMVVFFSGGGGNYYWTNDAPDFMGTLRSVHGFDVVQVRWAGAWQDPAAGQDAGASHVACRPATAIKHVQESLYVPPATLAVGRCGFCLVGSSGGASQIAYALTHYGLEGKIDAIIPTGGPTHAAQAKGCVDTETGVDRALQGYETEGGSTKQIDAPSGYTKTDKTSPWYFGNGPCRQKDPTWKPRWDAESVDTSGNDYYYATTRVHMILGRGDSVLRRHTADFAARLWLAPRPAGESTTLPAVGSPYVTYETVTGMGHGVTSSPEGMASLASALLRPGGVTACNNGIDDDDDGLTDFGTDKDPGCASGIDSNEITPGGAACDNGLDDDGDGRIDSGPVNTHEDPGCSGPTDTSERDPMLPCDDGLDNDGNGRHDFPQDETCTGANGMAEGGRIIVGTFTAGAGSGSITVNPAGTNAYCDAAGCYRSIAKDTAVTVTATPAAGSAFTGWSGVCTHSNPVCDFTANASKSATATFASSPGPFTLEVTKLAGRGTVTSGGNEISCAPECVFDSASFPGGSIVTLTATPAAGYAFTGWSGACTNGSGSCVVTMTQDRAVTANFVPVYVLTVEKDAASTGTGTVTSAQAGIECDAACTSDTGEFAEGTSVVLTAAESADSVFAGWGGACEGVAGPQCVVSMTEAKGASVRFDQVSYTLTVTVSGGGAGSVSSTPAGIADCRKGPLGTCEFTFLKGTQITLTANADPGSAASGFVGSCESATDTCTFTIQSVSSVTATFNVAPTSHTLVVDVNGPGSVSSSPPGIDGCRDTSGTCVAEFAAGETVTLTSTADSGASFEAYTGDCASSSPTCQVSMTGPKTVVATFTAGPAPFEVSVRDYSFSPKTATIAPGDAVRWTWNGAQPHSVVDAKNLGNEGPTPRPLYESGSQTTGTYLFTFIASGTYTYSSPNEPQPMTGTIRVNLDVSPLTGSATDQFTLRWAAEAIPAGFVVDVQKRFRPTGGSFNRWRAWGAPRTEPTGTFTPDSGTGTYQFRARLRNTATSVAAGWSPVTAISVD